MPLLGSVAHSDANRRHRANDQHDQDQRSGPRLPMPIIIGRERIGINLERESGGRLVRLFDFQIPELVLQKAVNSSGAVSPATRAKASITPVITPEVAVRSVIESVVRQRETPNP